jgi:hypothetical protein
VYFLADYLLAPHVAWTACSTVGVLSRRNGTCELVEGWHRVVWVRPWEPQRKVVEWCVVEVVIFAEEMGPMAAKREVGVGGVEQE